MEPPAGLVALLFTDIEGSTALARRLGPAWAAVKRDHHAILHGAITAEGGRVDGTEGDAFFATFADPAAAARAAVAAQRALRDHPWPVEAGELRVRMGLHVGHVEHTDTGYVRLEVHRAARVSAASTRSISAPSSWAWPERWSGRSPTPRRPSPSAPARIQPRTCGPS